MPTADRPFCATSLLIRCCIALALSGTANAQIISEIEVPQAREKPARKPKKAPRASESEGVTPAEVLRRPTQLLPMPEPATPRRAKPHGAGVLEDPRPDSQPASNENLSLPNIDAKRWCARISDRVATANCVQFEEKQREFARIFWEDLSENGKRHCAGTVARLGAETATNQSLAACVRTRLAQEEGSRSVGSPSVLPR